MNQTLTTGLLDFIDRSPSSFHVIANLRETLEAAGYQPLHEHQPWSLCPGGRYFVTRNASSLLAFRIPAAPFRGFMLTASHSDSPTFKLKQNPELLAAGQYLQLNTEKYGGMLMSSWFDRPLSVAGRVLARQDGRIVSRLVNIDRDLLIIPNVAIHMNRSANDGMKYQPHVDLMPLLGGADAKGALASLVAEAAGVAQADILGSDLFLYLRQRGTVLGAHSEYLAAPRLDDLECVYGCLQGFLSAQPGQSVPVYCVFDNEEVGSGTKQGAASTFLPDVLRRIALACGRSEQEYQMAVAESFLVSADNAHARHPNHPEYADAENCPYPNRGVVIKYNAAQHYTTDGVSEAIFRAVCAQAGVPVQTYANRSDLPGGSTLGNIANTQVSLHAVDIGLAQLAMHSSFETAGVQDLAHLTQAVTALYAKHLQLDPTAVF